MNVSELRGRHRELTPKQRMVTRVTASAAVAGGVVAGLSQAGSANADGPQAAQAAFVAHESSSTKPLFDTATYKPLQSLPVVAKAEAKKADATPAKVSRNETRKALTAPKPAEITTRQAAPVAKAEPKPQTQQATQAPAQVSRTQVRRTVTHAAPATTATKRSYTAPASSSRGAAVVAAASRLTGLPYVWGAASRSATDCSGLTMMAYQAVGVSLTHSSYGQQGQVTPVSSPAPGDLVFTPGHVAIYAGNGMVYEARHPGELSGLYPMASGAWYGRVN